MDWYNLMVRPHINIQNYRIRKKYKERNLKKHRKLSLKNRNNTATSRLKKYVTLRKRMK